MKGGFSYFLVLRPFLVIFFLAYNLISMAQCPVVSPAGIDSCKLSAGTVQLGASGSTGYYSWYDAAVGGNYLGSGSVFNTPHLLATTTYYVAGADTNVALDFDGNNDFVALGNPAQLQITGDLTIEMWLKPSNFSARRNPYAKAYGGEGTITQEPNGTLNFYYGTNGGNGTPYQGFNSGASLTLNQWNHIAIVRDLTNMQLYWYINGVLTNQANATFATATAGANVATIGSGYVSNYAGEIDEVRVWNAARTQVQIDINKGLCLTGGEVGLSAYYRFNDGTGSLTATDLTGNANHGTLTNMSVATDWVNAIYNYHCPSCESARTAVTATIGGGAGVNLGNDTAFACGITSINLDAGVGYVNYLWNTGATTQTISATVSGKYWVKVDDGAGCFDGDTISINSASGSLNALSFNGANNYVALGNPTQLQITGDLTIEMWLKPSNFSARRNPYAKAYGGEGTITQEPSGVLNFYYGTNGGNGVPYQGFNSGASLTLNQWNHIAIVRDLTNMQLYWYINGVLTNQANAAYAMAAAGSNFATIGSGYVSNYAGEIDELRVWSGARSQTEIRNKMCSKLLGDEAGLAAYYRFDAGTGTTLNDFSSNSIDGVLTNSPTWGTSGAAIGDASTYIYPVSWAGQILTHTYCGGENLTVSNMSGTPAGVHIYYVSTAPNVTTGITGFGTNNRYFGVFKVNDAAATYTATYDYTGNTHVGAASEPTVELFRRANNADVTWVNTVATLNTGANTLIATAQGTEFILGSSGVPLPIEIVSFEAKLNKNKVNLKWLTSTEINNDYFTIERSTDTRNWEEVLTVEGAGNSTELREYLQVDVDPIEGRSYYRLKQTDFDGEFEYFNIVPVRYEKASESIGSISLFPNPVNSGGSIQLQFKNIIESKVLVSIRDTQGRVTYSKTILNIENGKAITIPIDSNFPKGIYFVTVTSENEVYNEKLIVK